jgi:hypothetical protein
MSERQPGRTLKCTLRRDFREPARWRVRPPRLTGNRHMRFHDYRPWVRPAGIQRAARATTAAPVFAILCGEVFATCRAEMIGCRPDPLLFVLAGPARVEMMGGH